MHDTLPKKKKMEEEMDFLQGRIQVHGSGTERRCSRLKDRLGAEDTGLDIQVNLGLKAELLVAYSHLRMKLQWCEDKESRKMRRGLGEVRVGWGGE